MIEYTHLINHMLSLLKNAQHKAQKELHDLRQQLRELRRYSDMAKLIAYPNNPKNDLTYLLTVQHERDRYVLFRQQLSRVARKFLHYFSSHLSDEYRERIAALKKVKHLNALTKNPPEKRPEPSEGVVRLRHPEHTDWSKLASASLKPANSKPKP